MAGGGGPEADTHLAGVNDDELVEAPPSPPDGAARYLHTISTPEPSWFPFGANTEPRTTQAVWGRDSGHMCPKSHNESPIAKRSERLIPSCDGLSHRTA